MAPAAAATAPISIEYRPLLWTNVPAAAAERMSASALAAASAELEAAYSARRKV